MGGGGRGRADAHNGRKAKHTYSQLFKLVARFGDSRAAVLHIFSCRHPILFLTKCCKSVSSNFLRFVQPCIYAVKGLVKDIVGRKTFHRLNNTPTTFVRRKK